MLALLSVLLAAAAAGAHGVEMHGDDGGSGSLPAAQPTPDSAPGMDEDSVAEVSLLAVAAKHFSRKLGHLPTSPDQPRERMGLFRWSHYWRVYEELLRPIRHKPGAVFVEVGGFAGGSAQVWSEWLGPEVDVHIVDISDIGPMLHGVRVTVWQADQSNVSFWRDVFFPAVGKIDVLLDDGGHTAQQQTVTMREALPWVKPGGVLAVEDTHTSFMPPQFCGSLHEAEHVVRELRAALAANATGVTTDSITAGMPAYRVPATGRAELQPAVTRLLEAEAGAQTLCRQEPPAVLMPWSFVEEAKTLVTDLYAWWADDRVEHPGITVEDGSVTKLGSAPGLGQRLQDTRTLRGSLLGPEWRRWFARNVASVRFYESIVVVQRWWHEAGRAAPYSLVGGSPEARQNRFGDSIPGFSRLLGLPPGQRTEVPDEDSWARLGPHFRKLVRSVEARTLASRGERP